MRDAASPIDLRTVTMTINRGDIPISPLFIRYRVMRKFKDGFKAHLENLYVIRRDGTADNRRNGSSEVVIKHSPNAAIALPPSAQEAAGSRYPS